LDFEGSAYLRGIMTGSYKGSNSTQAALESRVPISVNEIWRRILSN
jgi:hypothetical protein